MSNKRPKSILLSDFIASLPEEEQRHIKERARQYELLFAFRRARKAKQISQAELAKKANINRTTLSQIETGQRNATLEVLMSLADALGMNLEIKLS